MSGHADTIRRELNFAMGWAYSEGADEDGVHSDAANQALDMLLAENQRLREALEVICEIGETRDVMVAREALAGEDG